MFQSTKQKTKQMIEIANTTETKIEIEIQKGGVKGQETVTKINIVIAEIQLVKIK